MALPLAHRHTGTGLGHRLFYEVCRQSAAMMLRTAVPTIVRHAERVPRTGPLLIVANHQSYLDPTIAGCFIYRHLDFIARSGLFKNERFGRLIDMLNSIPIREEGGDAAAMKEALRRLGMGRAVLVFPEGSRTFDGQLTPFKRGVAVLVKRAKCPVLPAAIEGAFEAWPRTRKAPKFGTPVAVTYGHPIPHDELMADGAEAALVRLHDDIDRMRLELRGLLRERTNGRHPPSGPGDAPASADAPSVVDGAAPPASGAPEPAAS